jgi:hypothetical protein
MTTLEHLRQADLLPMELPLMRFAEGSRAKTSALLEIWQVSANRQDQDYGANALVLLAKFDQKSQSLKTSQTCWLAQKNSPALSLAEYSATWPASGMMASGTIYQLPTLVPGTEGAEFGFLPTPIKSTSGGAAGNRWFGSRTYKNNLHEYLRDGPADPRHVNPDFCEKLMGFPIGHTELQP